VRGTPEGKVMVISLTMVRENSAGGFCQSWGAWAGECKCSCCVNRSSWWENKKKKKLKERERLCSRFFSFLFLLLFFFFYHYYYFSVFGWDGEQMRSCEGGE
jgi:hypothetical protein